MVNKKGNIMRIYFNYLKNAFLLLALLFIVLVDTNYGQWGWCSNSICPDLDNYTLSGKKWNKSELKYYFENGTNDILGDIEKTAFESAFNTWANAVPFTFIETFSSNEADIFIKYVQYCN